MKKLFILFFLVGLSFGQAKYFLPLPVESSNGRPIQNATVEIVPTGTTSGYISMTWLSSGWYYYTGGASTVAAAAYDICIVSGTDTTVWRSNISIGGAADVIREELRDSIAAYLDDSLGVEVQAWDTQLDDVADATFNTNFINIAWPWADNEVADNITASNYLPLATSRDSINAYLDDSIGVEVQAWDAQLDDLADGTLTGDFINTAYPWANNEVADDITASNYLLLTAVKDSSAAYSPPHGSFSFGDSAFVVALTQNSWATVTNGDNDLFTSNDADSMTWAGDSLAILADGDYMVHVSLSFSGSAADIFQLALWKDNAIWSVAMSRSTGQTDVGNVGFPWYGALTAGENLTLKIRNTASSDDATVVSCSWVIWRLHD